MKKAVSILVSAIALLSIVFVAIFGTQPQGIVPIIYVESMRIKPIDESSYKVNNDGQPYCTISYDENKEVTDGENSYMHMWQNTCHIAYIFWDSHHWNG